MKLRRSFISTVAALFFLVPCSPTFSNPSPTNPQAMTVTVNGATFEFVRIRARTFTMGSPTSEPERDDDEVQHQVTLTKDFDLQTTEVTQAQYQAVMRTNPSSFKTSTDLPVEEVSWNDAQAFIRKLNQLQGTTVYRLPTEAEWEYAARAGTTTPFRTGLNLTTDQANYNGNDPYNGNPKGQYRAKPTPVKTFPANPWGLYDMHGNVREWIQDWYGSYPMGSVTDPTGPTTGSTRVLRGGSWYDPARYCRAANRYSVDPSNRINNLGLRLARSR